MFYNILWIIYLIFFFSNVYIYGKVVLNLFFGMFFVSFLIWYGYFLLYNNVCRKKNIWLNNNICYFSIFVIEIIIDVIYYDNVIFWISF